MQGAGAKCVSLSEDDLLSRIYPSRVELSEIVDRSLTQMVSVWGRDRVGPYTHILLSCTYSFQVLSNEVDGR